MEYIQTHSQEVIIPCFVNQVDLHYTHENGENLIHTKYDFVFSNKMMLTALPVQFNYGFKTEDGRWENAVEYLSDESIWLKNDEEFQFSLSLCTKEKIELIRGKIQFQLANGETIISHEIFSSELTNTYNLRF